MKGISQSAPRLSKRSTDELAARYGPLIDRTCNAILKNKDLADDAAQQALIILFRKAHRLVDGPQLAHWCRITAKTISLQILRESMRRKKHESIAAVTHDRADSALPEKELDQKQNIYELRRALSGLPSKHREAIRLRYLNGYSLKDSALAAQCPKKTMEYRIYQGLAGLRVRLRQRGVRISSAMLLFLLKNEEAWFGLSFKEGVGLPDLIRHPDSQAPLTPFPIKSGLALVPLACLCALTGYAAFFGFSDTEEARPPIAAAPDSSIPPPLTPQPTAQADASEASPSVRMPTSIQLTNLGAWPTFGDLPLQIENGRLRIKGQTREQHWRVGGCLYHKPFDLTREIVHVRFRLQAVNRPNQARFMVWVSPTQDLAESLKTSAKVSGPLAFKGDPSQKDLPDQMRVRIETGALRMWCNDILRIQQPLPRTIQHVFVGFRAIAKNNPYQDVFTADQVSIQVDALPGDDF